MEMRIEAFSPKYLAPERVNLKPVIEEIPETIRYEEAFIVSVSLELPMVGILEVNMASVPFATHSLSQGKRLVKLTVTPSIPDKGGGV